MRNSRFPAASALSREQRREVAITGQGGVSIRCFEDWRLHALPPSRSSLHWKEGRSACELGRAWTSGGVPSVPPELSSLLSSHEGTRNVEIISGITEHETALPFSTRGPRCHDLALHATQQGESLVISIEAKADESFGGTVVEELRNARKRTGSRFPDRLDWLTRWLLRQPAFVDDARLQLSDMIAGLPYQLISGIAGVLLEAGIKRASKAILIVHEFRTALTTDARLDANAKALHEFLELFASRNRAAKYRPVQGDWMLGPFFPQADPDRVAAHAMHPIALYIGKVRTDRLSAAG